MAVGVKLEQFRGLIPRVSDRLLPPMNATVARNTKLISGELRGFREPTEDANLTGQASTIRRAYRVPDPPNPDAWLAFDSRDVDVIRSPLVNDGFDRYYWFGDGRPMYNTQARIANGDPAYYLGIPTPSTAPTVNPPAGSDETRAYVYTFESSFGEEGPPSPATIQSGNAGTWAISNLPAAPPDASFRDVTKINIYRTVSGSSTTSFYYVDEVNIGTTTYNDNSANSAVASNPLLESTTWAEPPVDMEGAVAMPNGYLVGWAGRRLLFSSAYRPHAWPAEFELSTEFPIVGLGVVGATLIIATESQPYFGQGVSPQSFTTQKIDAVEPCLSRRSIVSTTVGVIYASINGLVMANSSGVQVVTKDLFSKREWAELNPENIYAANLGLQYIAFNSTSFGFIIDPENPSQRHIELDNFTGVEGIETDRYSGNVLLLQNDRVNEWDPEGTARLQWRWTGKWNHLPKPMNFGAARILFDTGEQEGQYDVAGLYQPYNQEVFSDINGLSGTLRRLNTLGGQVLGGSPAKPQTGLAPTYAPPLIETKQPLGGSLLYDLAFLQLTVSSVRLIMRVRAKSKDPKVVFDKQILDESIIRLPTGFKSDLWQFELIGNTTVYSVQISETPNGLAEV